MNKRDQQDVLDNLNKNNPEEEFINYIKTKPVRNLIITAIMYFLIMVIAIFLMVLAAPSWWFVFNAIIVAVTAFGFGASASSIVMKNALRKLIIIDKNETR